MKGDWKGHTDLGKPSDGRVANRLCQSSRVAIHQRVETHAVDSHDESHASGAVRDGRDGGQREGVDKDVRRHGPARGFAPLHVGALGPRARGRDDAERARLGGSGSRKAEEVR